MGVSRTADQFVGKLKATEKVLGEQGDRRSLMPVAEVVKGTLERSAAQAGLRKGSKIAGKPWRGVYIRNQGARELAVGYASPAHLVNNRTKAHVIGARKLGTRKAINKRTTGASLIGFLAGSGVAASFKPRSITAGAKALHWGTNFAAYVRSPETRGKRFYERAKPVAQQEGGKAMQQSVSRALARVFG